ncbi:MAG: hypothetical protein HUU50_13845 [Candidatus Brocadiae bacterium]|nr:hypothetical protein [Candidatus Brocadiia bacterium]
MQNKTFILLIMLFLSVCHAAPVALIERAVGEIYGGGFFELALSSRGLSHDLYGTYSNAMGLQTLYNNLSQYSLVIFATNAGKNSTIDSIVSNSANQLALRNYLYNGGNIFMNVYNDGGAGANFLNLPGLSFSGADNTGNPYTVVNDDPIFHNMHEVLYQVQRVNSWEAISAFPTAATDIKVHLASGSYYTAVSFKWGAGRVFFMGQPVDSDHPQPWPGLEDIYGTTIATNFVENIYTELSGAVPEASSLVLIALGLGCIFFNNRSFKRR